MPVPGGVEADAQISLPGPFNVANALGAIVTLVEAGVPLQTAVHGVGTLIGVPGRMERITEAAGEFLAIVDYSHKPDAVESVLRSLRRSPRAASSSCSAAAASGTGQAPAHGRVRRPAGRCGRSSRATILVPRTLWRSWPR